MTWNRTQLLWTARIDYTMFTKDWWIAFVHRTQLSYAWSPTSAPKPWWFRGKLAVQVEYLRLFRGPRPPSYICQTLMKEAKPNQVRAQGQPKSSDIALCCDGGLWGGIVVKNPAANAGDTRDVGLIPGSRRVPGEENGNPLQYSCLENPTDRGAWQAEVHGVAKNWTFKYCLSSGSHDLCFPHILSPLTQSTVSSDTKIFLDGEQSEP